MRSAERQRLRPVIDTPLVWQDLCDPFALFSCSSSQPPATLCKWRALSLSRLCCSRDGDRKRFRTTLAAGWSFRDRKPAAAEALLLGVRRHADILSGGGGDWHTNSMGRNIGGSNNNNNSKKNENNTVIQYNVTAIHSHSLWMRKSTCFQGCLTRVTWLRTLSRLRSNKGGG